MQKDELDKSGFALLSADQLDTVYGKNSPYADPKLLKDFKYLVDSKQDFNKLIEDK